jgi:uncharacterized membrane protein YqaE (UPF0057 family)
MRKVILAVTCVLSFGMVFTSCSVEKRHYLNGYHVEWNKNNKKTLAVHEKAEPVKAITPVQQEAVMSTATTSLTENTVTAATPAAAKENASTNFSTPVVAKQIVTANEKSTATPQAKVLKQGIKAAKKAPAQDKPSKGLLILLCFILPWLAVGLATDWNIKKLIFNLLWSLTCIGGIIHALVVVNKSY